MHAGSIAGRTRSLGAPPDWNEARDGLCGALPIRDEVQGGMPCMVSAWFPTPEEIAALRAGAPIHLRVVGFVHPPVAVYVGEAPE